MGTLKFACRTLIKTPWVTAVAILSLALGIGANTAIFSVLDQMLLRPLPVFQPERLVNLSTAGWKPGGMQCNLAGPCSTAIFSYPMFRDLQRAHTDLRGIAAHVSFTGAVAYHNQTLTAEGEFVSGSYFPLLGIKPALGRLLSPGDDRTIGTNFVSVISYEYWANQLGSDPAVLGQTIRLNGQLMTIVGVAPKGFYGTTLGVRPKVFVPISMRGIVDHGFRSFDDRQSYWVYLFARLNPRVSVDRASMSINAAFHRVINNLEAPTVTGVDDKTIAQFRAKKITLTDGRRGQSSMRNAVHTPLILLITTSGIVLLIACSNIANLLSIRATSRSTEIVLRVALGASRWQVMKQLLAESFLLALSGAIASLVLARWVLSSLIVLVPQETASALDLHLNAQAVIFTAVLAVASALLFGLSPVLHGTKPNLADAIRAGSEKQSGVRAATRSRFSLVTAQIALSMMLLILAGLFLKSFLNVTRVNLGLDTRNVVTFGISPGRIGYSLERSRMLFSSLKERLSAIPGVTDVAASAVPVLSGDNMETAMAVEGFTPGPDGDLGARLNEVSSRYFSTMGIPLLAGRGFGENDVLDASKVAVVNEAFAKKFHLGREVLGKHISAWPDSTLDVEIVGLVKDAQYSEVKDPAPPQYFTPYLQDTALGSMTFYVRTLSNPERVERPILGVIKQLDVNLSAENMKTLSEQVEEDVSTDRMISTLSTAFAALATLLAAVGLYGVIAYSISRRTKEIGVRMALGADSTRVRNMVLRQVGLMAAIGATAGTAVGLLLAHAARSLLFEMRSVDPTVVIGAAVVLASMAFAAAYVPAYRASKYDPMHALRAD